MEPLIPTEQWEQNSVLLLQKLKHLKEKKGGCAIEALSKYTSVFSNVPRRTTVIEHDIDVGEATPVELRPS